MLKCLKFIPRWFAGTTMAKVNAAASVLLLSIAILVVLAIVISTMLRSSTCNRVCGRERVDYPFGFSGDCKFRLSCPAVGEMKFNGFGIRNITSETLLLNLPADCNRSIDQIDRLFGKNYALEFPNVLVLRNCSSSSSRQVEWSLLGRHFGKSMCKDRHGKTENMNYYDCNNVGTEILKHEDGRGTGCKFLFSAMVVLPNIKTEFQAIELAWWLHGACRCDPNAVCTPVPPAGFRCRCNEGFTGDGYLQGEGCRNGLSTVGNGQKGALEHRKRLVLAVLSGIAGVDLLAVFISIYCLCHKQRRKEPIGESENFLPNLSYKRLLKATDGFSSENLIGKGSSGVVYKGTLDEDQTIVAIKIFNLEHSGASKSFIAECQVLRHIRHRNLVKVITACSGVDYRAKDFKALIYEYMANGSLEDWLHQRPMHSVDKRSNAAQELNVIQRLDIAVDVAFALEYLHHHCDMPIVHCDLKPSNVLLDDEMVAHVSDFGLAKFLPIGITSQTLQSSSVGVRGTIGYTPPEYGLGNKPSTHGDVYSFGILVLELLTRKRPTDSMFTDGLSLPSFAQAAWPERVMEILDPVLEEDIVGEEMNTEDQTHHMIRIDKSKVILEALTSVLGIALSCSAELPQARMDMRDVAAKLSLIRNKLPPCLKRQRRMLAAGAGTQGY